MKKINLKIVIVLVIISGCFFACEEKYDPDKEIVTKNKYHVKTAADGGSDSNNGRTWSTAFASLSKAISVANNGGGDTIFVAKGTYIQDAAYVPTVDMKIFGSFDGYEKFPEQRRQPYLREDDITSILNGNNKGAVFEIRNLTDETIIDGFVITGGSSNDCGGIFISKSSPTLTNLIISGNTSTGYGGGINTINSSPVLTNIIISGNTATTGGGMYSNDHSYPILTNVTISENTASFGGGMSINNVSSPMLRNVTISGNTANREGGGMLVSVSYPSLTNVIISGNTAIKGGGVYCYNSAPLLTNVTISGNTAMAGGGMYNYHASTPILTNVTISGNTVTDEGGGIFNLESSPKIYNSIVLGNFANKSNGVINYSSSPIYAYNLIEGEGTDFGYHNGTNWDNKIYSAIDVFVNPSSAGLNTGGNYSLKTGSVAIDKGSLSYWETQDYVHLNGKSLLMYFGGNWEMIKDLSGNPRIVGVIDLGAYEYPSVQ